MGHVGQLCRGIAYEGALTPIACHHVEGCASRQAGESTGRALCLPSLQDEDARTHIRMDLPFKDERKTSKVGHGGCSSVASSVIIL